MDIVHDVISSRISRNTADELIIINTPNGLGLSGDLMVKILKSRESDRNSNFKLVEGIRMVDKNKVVDAELVEEVAVTEKPRNLVKVSDTDLAKKLDFIGKVVLSNAIVGNPNSFDKKSLSLYMGLICEEFSETLAALGQDANGDLLQLRGELDRLGTLFKKDLVITDVEAIDKVEVLDGLGDLAVVSTGGAVVLGSNVSGAFNAIADNNLSKFKYDLDTGDYVVLKDENGKYLKPADYVKVDLLPFVDAGNTKYAPQ